MDPQAEGGWARARMEAAKTTIKRAITNYKGLTSDPTIHTIADSTNFCPIHLRL
jgi:hypothetical protein